MLDTRTEDSSSKLYGQSNNKNKLMLKAKYSFYSTILFFLFANPETYHMIQLAIDKCISGISVVDSYGTPSIVGLFINTSLFFFTMISIMLLS